MKHLYLKFILGLTLMSFASPILAKSSKKTTAFMSNVEGAVATAYRKRKELGNCVTPCTLPIAIKKLDFVDFSHPNYPDTYFVERNLEKIRKDAKETEGPIAIYGRFGPSYSEAAIEKDREIAERYASEYASALASGDAPAKALKMEPPNIPLKHSRSGWCKLRFTVTKTGHTTHIEIVDCSENVFASPAKRALGYARFIPQVINGSFEDQKDKELTFTTLFYDKSGKLVPPIREKS